MLAVICYIAISMASSSKNLLPNDPAFDEQPIDEALKPVLEHLSGTELAALYLGHVELLLNLQRQQREGESQRQDQLGPPVPDADGRCLAMAGSP